MLLASDVTCLFPDLKALIKPSIALPATLSTHSGHFLQYLLNSPWKTNYEDSADFALLTMDFTDELTNTRDVANSAAPAALNGN